MMTMRLKAPAVLMGFLLASYVLARSQATPARNSAVASLGAVFVSVTAPVNGTTLHYVRGRTGPAVILLHGFPEDWYEYHHVMPLLAKHFTVVAVDLRGIGGSAATRDGYDAANMAEYIHQLAEELQLEHVYVVGHGFGGVVAYAFGRLYPETSRGVMLLDAPVPGPDSWEDVQANFFIWHIKFHQTPDLPEQLIARREAVYFRYFLGDRNIFRDADVAHYAKSYAAPEHLRAGLEIYRSFPANEKFNAAQWSTIGVPLVLAPGENSHFEKLMPRLAETLRAHGCTSVKLEVIKNSVHYVADEEPEAVVQLIERYASL